MTHNINCSVSDPTKAEEYFFSLRRIFNKDDGTAETNDGKIDGAMPSENIDTHNESKQIAMSINNYVIIPLRFENFGNDVELMTTNEMLMDRKLGNRRSKNTSGVFENFQRRRRNDDHQRIRPNSWGVGSGS